MALTLEDITAGYGRTTVLRQVCVTVRSHSVVALLGPNGAGKTTLLRVAAGLLQPMSGRVVLGDVDVTRKSANQRGRHGLCLIPEGRGIFRELTVRENLRLQRPPWVGVDHTDDVLARFPMLGQRLGQVAGTMSGGQQQMLALARALMSEPSVILVDEASMGLAPIVVDEIFETLRAIAATGIALVIVEQFVDRALELADEVVLLDRGRVSASGDAANVDRDALVRSYLGGLEPGDDGVAAVGA
jgi:branched-chain amino acid transport system ATP-binding protein